MADGAIGTAAITLRAMTAADVPAVAALARDAFVAKFGSLYRPADLAAFLGHDLADAGFAADLANSHRAIMLAQGGDGRLLGFAKVALECGFPDHARGRRVMELKQLYTARGATGQGIGARLMDWAMARLTADGADEVQLSVYAGNDGAHRFYRRYGFDKVADITFRVGDQLDPEYLFARMI